MPWHPGELKIQTALGYKNYVSHAFMMVQNEMSNQHRQFYPMLPFTPFACIDDQGRPWGAIIAGKGGTGGFIRSPTPNELTVRIGFRREYVGQLLTSRAPD